MGEGLFRISWVALPRAFSAGHEGLSFQGYPLEKDRLITSINKNLVNRKDCAEQVEWKCTRLATMEWSSRGKKVWDAFTEEVRDVEQN